MKGLTGSRNPPQLCPGHTCGFTPLDGCSHAHELTLHGPEVRRPYLLSPTDSCPGDRHRCSPRSSVHSDCVMVPVVLGDHVSSSTFPRTHCSSHYDTRDDCAVSHASAKSHRIPANLLDQFEKQLPLHRDGFHTLQYQRASAPEHRGESPGRIRHLVHSVQKLFTKSHSLEGASKSHVNGAKADGRVDDHHGRHAKHGRRSKSKERAPEAKPRAGPGSWWSSDDNLDSDSTYRAASVAARHLADHGPHCYPEPFLGPFAGLSLKPSKSNSDVKCSACEGLAVAPEAAYMKRSSWSTLTVSQAKEACRQSSLNLDRPLAHQDVKPPLRACHYLQVRRRAAGPPRAPRPPARAAARPELRGAAWGGPCPRGTRSGRWSRGPAAPWPCLRGATPASGRGSARGAHRASRPRPRGLRGAAGRGSGTRLVPRAMAGEAQWVTWEPVAGPSEVV